MITQLHNFDCPMCKSRFSGKDGSTCPRGCHAHPQKRIPFVEIKEPSKGLSTQFVTSYVLLVLLFFAIHGVYDVRNVAFDLQEFIKAVIESAAGLK